MCISANDAVMGVIISILSSWSTALRHVTACRYCATCVGVDGSISIAGDCAAAVSRSLAAACAPLPGVLCGDGYCGGGEKCCGAFPDRGPACVALGTACPANGNACGYMNCVGQGQHCCQGLGPSPRFCSLDASFSCAVPVSALADGAACFASPQCASFNCIAGTCCDSGATPALCTSCDLRGGCATCLAGCVRVRALT